jgi:Xaa-Pro dipeptidase
MYAARLQTLRQIAAQAGLDAIALMPGRNLIYVTGQHFHLMERPTLALYPREGDPIMILPLLEVEKFAHPPYPLQTFTYSDADGPEDAFAAGLAAAGLAGKRLGVEGLALRFVEMQLVQRHAPGIVLVDATEPLAALRLNKGEPEVAALRRAIQISQDALRATVAAVRPGMTERQIANRLMIGMLERGGGALAFDPAVQGGPRSALPHGAPGDYALQDGDLLLFDFGTIVDDYGSDITRTFVVGELRNTQLQDAYAAVLAANEAGRQTAGPGVPAQEVDRAARAVITQAGFGEYFRHRTGHGLGMDVHEPPYIREGNAAPLEVGNIFTVEPGVYLPDVGGIRIEDDVLITPDGAESLTTFPRELQSIGG